MGTSSGTNFNQQQLPAKLQPPNQQPRQLQTSLSFVSSDAHAAIDIQEPASNSEHARESPSESASSRETWSADNNRSGAIIMKKVEKEVGESEGAEQSVVRRISSANKISLRDIARDRVETVAERMKSQPEELLEELKSELRIVLEGMGGAQNREEFLLLQTFVRSRTDLTAKSLMRAHRVQLEILVAINTGIQAFLHPSVSLPQTFLIEIFVYKRCRNIACQSPLPADDCNCEKCTNRSGFCNLCMCVICNKFDFEVNTCRWIGCDSCSHWTHTDCAIRDRQIGNGLSSKCGDGLAEMLFKCKACNRTSELLGWVKDVFQHCAPGWDRESLMRELDFVCRIFHGSEDMRGRKLYWKCEELIEKLKSGAGDSIASKMIIFFQELDVDSMKNPESEEGERLIAPHEACNRIVEVVQEALRKMDMVAEEKMRMFKKARLALEACDRELEDKAREVAELQVERQRKKQQIDELESIVRLKQAEADMFQLKASEARREAERLQRIALAKLEKSEEEYASRYLKLRLNEAEAEKQYLFEKIKLQESSRAAASQSSGGGDTSQMLMLCKIQDLLKNVYNVPLKSEGKSDDQHSLHAVP